MENRDNFQPFRSILLATDFTVVDRVAARYAALMAQHYAAELIVAHAFLLQQPALEAEILGHTRSMQRGCLENLLSETINEVAPYTLRVQSFLGEGDPIDVIAQALQKYRPTMIVLGTHGGGAMDRHLVGSVAETILRQVPDPVLTVGPHVAMPSMDRLAFRHILYATDFSDAASHASSHAYALAKNFGSDLDVLHVISPDAMGEYDFLIRREGEVMEALRESFRPSRAPFRYQTFVELGKTSERILEHARERGNDLIVLGAHQHSRLAMHLRTGPAFQTIINAACPVLTVCAAQEQPSIQVKGVEKELLPSDDLVGFGPEVRVRASDRARPSDQQA